MPRTEVKESYSLCSIMKPVHEVTMLADGLPVRRWLTYVNRSDVRKSALVNVHCTHTSKIHTSASALQCWLWAITHPSMPRKNTSAFAFEHNGKWKSARIPWNKSPGTSTHFFRLRISLRISKPLQYVWFPQSQRKQEASKTPVAQVLFAIFTVLSSKQHPGF